MFAFLLNPNGRYDYIIAGAGCAGLSLLVHMIHSGGLENKKILLIDREIQKQNDRTWCFWETVPGLFEPIVYRQWEQAWFYGEGFSSLLQLHPYTYKLIRGIDFYEHCFELIRRQSNIDILKAEIKEIDSERGNTYVVAGDEKIYGDIIFSSIIPPRTGQGKKDISLLQHFKGWVIETEAPVFHLQQATLMDFRVTQEHGCAFAYVMPFSSTRALVEFTLFTGQLLQPMQYEEGLRLYIHRFITAGPYHIAEEEYGVIPMTSYRFPARHNSIVYIGTAGGQTKASSGYTFRFIQKHSAAIVAALRSKGQPVAPPPASRFHFYDRVLLDILHRRNEKGKPIFTELFRKNKPQQVLRFLDNETTLGQELGLIASLPTWPFLHAALRQLL